MMIGIGNHLDGNHNSLFSVHLTDAAADDAADDAAAANRCTVQWCKFYSDKYMAFV